MDAWVSQIRKGMGEVVILGMLARGEMYGSQIVSALSDREGLAISAGTVYPLLSRLKKAGLIEAMWVESPVGPPRKYSSLTESGTSELEQMARAWREVARDVNGVLEGIFDGSS